MYYFPFTCLLQNSTIPILFQYSSVPYFTIIYHLSYMRFLAYSFRWLSFLKQKSHNGNKISLFWTCLNLFTLPEISFSKFCLSQNTPIWMVLTFTNSAKAFSNSTMKLNQKSNYKICFKLAFHVLVRA